MNRLKGILSGVWAGLGALAFVQGVAGAEWPGYNRTLDGQRFATGTQLTPATAPQLRERCRLVIEPAVPMQGGLVVTGGVLYATTTHHTVAMDATNCHERWRHIYVPEEEEVSPPNRGVAVLDGRVFRGTADGRLIALDARTGQLLWKDVVGNPRLGEFVSGAPLAWQGVVFAGIAGGDRGIRGRVMAYDAQTGRELWRFNTIPMGSETGAETWQRPETAATGGGGTWSTFSLDVTSGELFVPVGNPGPDLLPGYRPGANLFTNSLVVLDARTGALKWWYQLAPSDARDLDLGAAPLLYRRAGGQDVAAFAGKEGHLWAVDRRSHQLLWRTPVTTIRNEGVPVTPEGGLYCPGAGGGTQWNGPALDAGTQSLIVGAVDLCFEVRAGTAEYVPGQIFYAGTMKPVGAATGWITSVDSGSGAVRWQYHAEAPVVAGITPTAGGVTLAGDLHGNLLILDTRDGHVLLNYPTGGAIAGGIVSYDYGDTQYVALTSGNVSRNTYGLLGTPSVIVMALPAAVGHGLASSASRGRERFRALCAECHGSNGSLLAGFDLRTVKSRRDHAGILDAIRNPRPPMPSLYPQVLDDRALADVDAYLEQELAK